MAAISVRKYNPQQSLANVEIAKHKEQQHMLTTTMLTTTTACAFLP
jgi:hypothetical protein